MDKKKIDHMFSILDEKIKEADQKRFSFSRAILPIYTALTSALFLLSLNGLQLNSGFEKLAFYIIAITTPMIVFSIILEKYAHYLLKDFFVSTTVNIIRKEFDVEARSIQVWWEKLFVG